MIIAVIRSGEAKGEKFGKGFKGLISYLLKGAKGDENRERVAHAETYNTLSDIHDAAYEMALTGAFRDERLKKKRAKLKADQEEDDDERNVYHCMMSWHPSENPPDGEGMAQLARELLFKLGLHEHEAVFVAHKDTENPHLHIVVNRVHPTTGRQWNKINEHYIMQKFAADWMKANGLELWTLGAGNGQRDSRAAYERKRKLKREAEIAAMPAAILKALTDRQSTFTDAQLAKAVTDETNNPEEFARVMAAVRALPDFVTLDGEKSKHWYDQKGGFTALTPEQQTAAALAWADWSTQSVHNRYDLMSYVQYVHDRAAPVSAKRYTTQSLRVAELRLAANAEKLAGAQRHAVRQQAIDDAKAAVEARAAKARAAGRKSDPTEALAVLDHLLDRRGLSLLVGYAGTGKSTIIGDAARAWEACGYRPRGLAIAARTAKALQIEAGITSQTIHKLLARLENGTERIDARDVFVVDEAGMVGSRQMDKLMAAITAAGAKLVLVGDREQLQAIDAGGPFGWLQDHYDHAKLTKVHRQGEEWMQDATVHFAEGKTADALEAYRANGMTHEHATDEDAISTIMDEWQAGWDLGGTQIILAATNALAVRMHDEARARLKEAGKLGRDELFNTVDGGKLFASGDRILFKKNDTLLGVMNGDTGTVTKTDNGALVVSVDVPEGQPPRNVVVDPETYGHFRHAYAVTNHFAQGISVHRAYVLASKNMDRHAAYVSMSRHRTKVAMHWSKDQFKDWAALTRRLSRKGLKDTSLDYTDDVRAAIAEMTADVGMADDTDMVEAWSRLYDKQRYEEQAYERLGVVGRVFWTATNKARFWWAKTTSLAKLHEKERAAMHTHMKGMKAKAKARKPKKPSTTNTQGRGQATSKPRPKSASQVLFNNLN